MVSNRTLEARKSTTPCIRDRRLELQPRRRGKLLNWTGEDGNARCTNRRMVIFSFRCCEVAGAGQSHFILGVDVRERTEQRRRRLATGGGMHRYHCDGRCGGSGSRTRGPSYRRRSRAASAQSGLHLPTPHLIVRLAAQATCLHVKHPRHAANRRDAGGRSGPRPTGRGRLPEEPSPTDRQARPPRNAGPRRPQATPQGKGRSARVRGPPSTNPQLRRPSSFALETAVNLLPAS